MTLTQSFRIAFIVFEFTVGLMNMKVTTSCTLSLITFTNGIEIEIKNLFAYYFTREAKHSQMDQVKFEKDRYLKNLSNIVCLNRPYPFRIF